MRALIFILIVQIANAPLAIAPMLNDPVSLYLGGVSSSYFNAFAIENDAAELAFFRDGISLDFSNRFRLSEYSQAMFAGNIERKFASVGFAYRIPPFFNFKE